MWTWNIEEKKMKITITNNFHNTETEITTKALENAVDTYFATEGKKTTSAAKRVWSELCGIKGCGCGDFLGMRGPQENEKHIPIEISYRK